MSIIEEERVFWMQGKRKGNEHVKKERKEVPANMHALDPSFLSFFLSLSLSLSPLSLS